MTKIFLMEWDVINGTDIFLIQSRSKERDRYRLKVNITHAWFKLSTHYIVTCSWNVYIKYCQLYNCHNC